MKNGYSQIPCIRASVDISFSMSSGISTVVTICQEAVKVSYPSMPG